VAIIQANTTAIASGLAAGDMVVTDGQDKLQAGMKVEPRVGGGSRGAGNGVSNPQDSQNSTSGAQ
jgi:hypothetical protein